MPRSDITTRLSGSGFSTEVQDALFADITAAGYELTPIGGGTPVAAGSTTPVVARAVNGRPGAVVFAASVGSRGWITWLELVQTGPDGKTSVLRLPGGFVARPDGDSGGAFD